MTGSGTTRLTASALSVGWKNCIVSSITDLELRGGECLVLAGPNGCGKSTVVKTLARQIKPISGAVQLDDNNIANLPSGEFARKVAYVPQSVEIFRQITVEEWVSLGRNPHQSWWSWQKSDSDVAAVEDALAKTGLHALRGKFMDSLSGGERQRASIAMALAQEPHILLLDEPSAHLDFQHQLELVELLIDLRQTRQIGVLVVLHDLNLIARLATKVILLKKSSQGIGEVAYSGSPEEVLQPEKLAAVYNVDVTILVDSEIGITGYFPSRVHSP
jgi:iron complex transport system ATP-binding protein